jgi:hypothetical protein
MARFTGGGGGIISSANFTKQAASTPRVEFLQSQRIRPKKVGTRLKMPRNGALRSTQMETSAADNSESNPEIG